eukprot:1720025-Rhodomonas_salina.3
MLPLRHHNIPARTPRGQSKVRKRDEETAGNGTGIGKLGRSCVQCLVEVHFAVFPPLVLVRHVCLDLLADVRPAVTRASEQAPDKQSRTPCRTNRLAVPRVDSSHILTLDPGPLTYLTRANVKSNAA